MSKLIRLRKVSEKSNSMSLTLPSKFIQETAYQPGDYFELQTEGNKLVFVPMTVIEKEFKNVPST